MDTLSTALGDFFGNPLVAGLWALLVLSLLDLLLGVYRSIQQGVFDWQKLPQILDTVVLQKVIPLAALGIASYLVADPTKTTLQAAYVAATAAALAGELAAFISKATGSYVATSLTKTVVIPGGMTSVVAPPSTSSSTDGVRVATKR